MADLPSRDVDPARSETIRIAAHRVLTRQADRHRRTAGIFTTPAYDRFVEPLVVYAVAGIYLLWALQSVYAILVR